MYLKHFGDPATRNVSNYLLVFRHFWAPSKPVGAGETIRAKLQHLSLNRPKKEYPHHISNFDGLPISAGVSRIYHPTTSLAFFSFRDLNALLSGIRGGIRHG
ncbi:hypothetical protein [Methanospirillum stamsii]|uniref:Uncharacterized protein n=1 Tax=Methanospirillum stamsii TaxID=1277351 RepID=A0A2V2MTW6_9EURY|nr:hypothetical protein [Methanospirillum stamsii]PWR69585.1 hypothetical protein DLD82_17585 [Methanospirillum stamsii]